jgi:hypothetical protein
MPNMMAQARPEKMGSSVITQLPSSVVPAVARIGRVRTATLWITASRNGVPSRTAIWMNSISTAELRTTIPASAIMPIMAVAVKNIGSG